MKPQVKSFLVSALLFIVSTIALQLLLHDWTKTAILVGSVFLHEMGHWAALKYYGVNSQIYLIPLLGAITLHRKDASEQLGDKERINYIIAGPIVNFVLLGIGLVLLFTGNKLGHDIAFYNASLAYTNLLPIISWVDGGRICRLIFKNLTIKDRNEFSNLSIGTPGILISLIVANIKSWSTVAIGINLVLWILVWLSWKSDAKKLESPAIPTLSFKRTIATLVIYCLLMYTSTFVYLLI